MKQEETHVKNAREWYLPFDNKWKAFQPNYWTNSVTVTNDYMVKDVLTVNEFEKKYPNFIEKNIETNEKQFRIGRKKRRAILHQDGREFLIFSKGKEKEARDYCEFLNNEKKYSVREMKEMCLHTLLWAEKNITLFDEWFDETISKI